MKLSSAYIDRDRRLRALVGAAALLGADATEAPAGRRAPQRPPGTARRRNEKRTERQRKKEGRRRNKRK